MFLLFSRIALKYCGIFNWLSSTLISVLQEKCNKISKNIRSAILIFCKRYQVINSRLICCLLDITVQTCPAKLSANLEMQFFSVSNQVRCVVARKNQYFDR